MKKTLAILVSVVLMATTLSSCCFMPMDYFGIPTGLLENTLGDYVSELMLVGTWESDEEPGVYMVLEKDGTGKLENDSGASLDLEWYVEDGLLYMDVSLLGFTQTIYDGVQCSFYFFDSLTIEGEDRDVSFTRVR